jgi:hypothetical protein
MLRGLFIAANAQSKAFSCLQFSDTGHASDVGVDSAHMDP